MNDMELILDELIEEEPFFEIRTKQDIDEIVEKLDRQLWKIYEMNLYLDTMKKEMGTSGARRTNYGKTRKRSSLKGPVSSAIKLKEMIIGNFYVRKRGQYGSSNNMNRKRRRRYRR